MHSNIKPHPKELELHANTLQHIVRRLGNLRLKESDPAARKKLARRMRLYKAEEKRVLVGSPTAYARICDYHTRYSHILYCFRNDFIGIRMPRRPIRPFHYEDYVTLAYTRDTLAKIRTLPEYQTEPMRDIMPKRRKARKLSAG